MFNIFAVGGGTAGCLVANRLSQYFSVLLLEAGGPAPSLTTVPGFRSTSRGVKEINYFYTSVKQPHVANRVRYNISNFKTSQNVEQYKL
jgi:choline dehydrogenase-like flavoprotein